MDNAKMNSLYQIINGIRIPVMFKPHCFKEVLNYKAKPEDIFIVTYPKCGTTWMQYIALHIFRKGKELEDPRDFKILCPFIDNRGKEGINNMPRPGAFKTHLPFDLVPYSPESKYIIVLRNPKDCCVSLYYHTKRKCPGKRSNWNGNFNDFFEMFMTGEVEYNDYFDHLMSWYPHRNDSQIFVTTYEDMKKDMKEIILKLASFLGHEYIEAIEMDNNVLRNIMQFSSFEYMKQHLSEEFDSKSCKDKKLSKPDSDDDFKHREEHENSASSPDMEKMHFFRKGIVGDGKNHFSEEQSEKLKNKFLERLQGTEIVEMYKPYM